LRYAILADIHSNLEALDSCLAAAPAYDLVVAKGGSKLQPSKANGRNFGVGCEAVLFAVSLRQIAEAEVGLVDVFRGRVVLDAVDQFVASGPEVRTARVGGVVARASCRRPRMEVLGLCEALAEQRGANHVAFGVSDQAASGLVRERDAADTPHDAREGQAREDDEEQCEDDSGA